MYVRPPVTPPDTSSLASPPRVRHIIFRHPGYDDACNVLLKLFAPDASSSSSSSAGIGLHAGYALTACGIVAGNRWDGWLSEHKHSHGGRDDTAQITMCAADRGKMLNKHSYYFHLPYDDGDDNTRLPYPIVPTFREWAFPHDQLPPSWTQIAPPELFEQPQRYSVSGLTTALRQRDVTCRITGYREECQTAHLCPQAEEDWYLRNNMPRYNYGNSESVDDPANALLLRADLHIAFDKPSFVFVPKPSDVELQQLVLHLLEPSREFEFLYHNRAMQSLGVSVELLFARLAWTIFPLVAGFLKGKIRRRLRLSTISKDNGTEMAPFFASAEQCEDMVTRRPKSRNASPKKRGRPDDGAREGEAVTDASREDEHHRSRKRHRSSNSAQDPTAINSTNIPSPTTTSSFHDAARLRQEWLHNERQRSDPSRQWEEEMAWAAGVYKGDITLGEANAKRWIEFNGGEYPPNENL